MGEGNGELLAKQLGGTSMALPAIGFGAGDLFWDSNVTHEKKVGVLRLGLELGMSLIDTGEAYGDGASELIVAEALKGIRETAILATKVAPAHHAYVDLIRAAEKSLERLGTEYIDLYQIHWPNPSVPLDETMEAMARLVDSGKVRFVGLCNVTKAELKDFQQALGNHKLVSLQNEYNPFERTFEYSGLISYCQDNQISPIAYGALDQGRINAMNPQQFDLLSQIAEAHSQTVAQVVLRWLVNKPGVVALVRSTNESHVRENAAAANFDLSEFEVDQIDRAFQYEIIRVDTDRIRVSMEGEGNRAVYQTLEEAMKNNYGFSPSPVELSRSMISGDLLKPVRLVPSVAADYEYDLIGGRIRYWAWVIAHQGNLPIPACVRRDIYA